ncbi:tigger transposable element-derived protein 6-like [Panonychus citri]|uniref:tigger transposable element-derived protein 6-like n=1 Tax=Panonychus citri TaxID=50023 RepID=UPI00230715A9|nr:tigger transposable element-derived protein 6-like [Panonychus citri]
MASRTRLPNKDKFTKLDQVMKEYCQLCINKGFNFNSLVIKAKARLEANKLGIIGFRGSRTWFQKFTLRNNLTYVRISGESKSVDDSVLANYLSSLPEKLANYSPDEIYNADETGLQYKCQNSYSYSFQTDDRHGTKSLKNHVSILLCASLSGIKRKPLIIGSARKSIEIWKKWLVDWDQELVKDEKKVLLFIDNCSCHNNLPNLSNLKVEFFPSNCTSICQPLDAGIFAILRIIIAIMLISKLITTDASVNELLNSINLLHVVEWSSEAWESVTQLTITNCFDKCGFIK